MNEEKKDNDSLEFDYNSYLKSKPFRFLLIFLFIALTVYGSFLYGGKVFCERSGGVLLDDYACHNTSAMKACILPGDGGYARSMFDDIAIDIIEKNET